MQIASVLELARRKNLPPLQQKTLAFLEGHPEEVFAYRDEKLATELGSKPSAIGFTLWALHKAGLIEKETVAGKVYFGSRDAIVVLRRGLGKDKGDALERITANAEKIRARVGNLNSLQILDELRSSNELA
jgi:hypothetical protein